MIWLCIGLYFVMAGCLFGVGCFVACCFDFAFVMNFALMLAIACFALGIWLLMFCGFLCFAFG